MRRLVAALFALSLGCDAVVDGSCSDGYEYCDGACRPIGACHTSDSGTVDSIAVDSGENDTTIDATAEDASAIDSASEDSAVIDATAIDSATGDSAAIDSPAAIDSATGDSTTIDSTPVDASGVDGASPDTAPPDTCPPPPYSTPTHCGACGVVCAGATPSCKARLDGTYGCGPVCDAPTTLCPAGCVDLDVDPTNCGACGKTCPTGLCNGGKCRGAKSGHVVVIGHDFTGATPALSVSRVLVNAVFLPPKNPVRVLSYEQWSEPTSVARVKAILDDGALASGRTYVKSVATSLADFRDRLLIDKFDVALVFDQPNAPAGALSTVGVDAAVSLDSFSRVGGVVVVLDGASGISQMPQFLTASTMLGTSAHTTITGKAVDVVAPADAIGVGVLSPYSAPTRSVSFTVTEPPSTSLVTVVSEPVSAKPVVLHKVVFK